MDDAQCWLTIGRQTNFRQLFYYNHNFIAAIFKKVKYKLRKGLEVVTSYMMIKMLVCTWEGGPSTSSVVPFNIKQNSAIIITLVVIANTASPNWLVILHRQCGFNLCNFSINNVLDCIHFELLNLTGKAELFCLQHLTCSIPLLKKAAATIFTTSVCLIDLISPMQLTGLILPLTVNLTLIYVDLKANSGHIAFITKSPCSNAHDS